MKWAFSGIVIRFTFLSFLWQNSSIHEGKAPPVLQYALSQMKHLQSYNG